MKVTPLDGISAKRKRGVQGKIARRRQKDNKFAGALKTSALQTITESSDAKSSPLVNPFKEPHKKLSQLNIKIDDLKNNLTSNCVPVTRDEFPKHFPKKDKRKLRRDTFVKKLEAVNELQTVNKKQKLAKKTAGVSVEVDTSTPVEDTEVISTEVKELKNERKTPRSKLKPILKKKDRLKQELQDMKLFEQLLSQSIYKANLGGAITD